MDTTKNMKATKNLGTKSAQALLKNKSFKNLEKDRLESILITCLRLNPVIVVLLEMGRLIITNMGKTIEDKNEAVPKTQERALYQIFIKTPLNYHKRICTYFFQEELSATVRLNMSLPGAESLSTQ